MEFIGWFIFFIIYSGLIILFYGNLVSVGTEYVQKKWFKHHNWLYVLILGIFGLAFGVLTREIVFILYGLISAVVYAVVDKCLEKRFLEEKSIKAFILIPLAAVLVTWSFLQFTSPPKPEFTIEDAVQLATAGDGTMIDLFPKEIGKWEGTVDGYAYQVTRETSAEEIEEEVYKVSFTETWGNEFGERSWVLTYIVKRNSVSGHSKEGIVPPYYKK